MEFKDYYTTLGVSKTATQEEIKSAYRKLARKFHPDVSKEPDAEQKMQAVNEANAVLSDPEKRAAYDQVGQGYRPGQDFQPPPDWGAGFEFSGSGFDTGDMGGSSDFFSQLFGHAARAKHSTHQMRGEDSHARILVDLAASYQGASQSISLRVPQTGANGQVTLAEHVIQVSIPKGIKPGQHLRVAGQGHPGFNGGPAGDLFLEIQFKPDAHYRVDGVDVYASLPLAPWEAALGTSIDVPTPSGSIQVKIPPNSQGGRKLRLKGKGIPASPPGDFYLLLEIVLPPADSERARELYTAMARDLAFKVR
jgi:curved DNA-binding protein